MSEESLSGNIVDLVHKKIYPGTLFFQNGTITRIRKDSFPLAERFLLPGFIDSHIHIESSMLIPTEFARLASVHGTVATVSDPHEIGNVLGIDGIRYMIQNGEKSPFRFFFGASSCVPATSFETAGAKIGPEEIRILFEKEGLHYLSEMMNFPGVLHGDPEVMKKIEIAKSLDRPVDGHAPGLRGEDAKRYIAAGISTDHECFTLDEALDKVRCGMKILIREGSAAKNFETLHPLIKSHPDKVMFCSDDKHPHELVKGHINEIVRRAIVDKGYDAMDVLRAACLHPIQHYKLDVGYLRVGDPADFIVVNNLRDFRIEKTFIQGVLVAENGKSLIRSVAETTPNRFTQSLTSPDDFKVKAEGKKIRVIEALEGELVTNELDEKAKIVAGNVVADPSRDILKLAVVNRYRKAPPAIGFIKNFGLKHGAIASCVAHDSHNIIAVGVTDEEIALAVNALMKAKGGIAAVHGTTVHVLPLPVAGIMSHEDGYTVAKKYAELDAEAKRLGSTLQAPYMTLSFMALLVIPALKLSDKGLFDGKKFAFTDLALPAS